MASIPPSVTSLSAETAASRDARLAVGAGTAVVLAVSWGVVLYMSWGMDHMDVVADSLLIPSMMNWDVVDVLRVFVMWTIMMVAMMLPSAAPLLLLVSKIHTGRYTRARAILTTAVFALGYCAVWTGFSLLATLAQWGLLESRLVSPMMESANLYLSAGLLAAAGAYEFTPLKNMCLTRCRSPLRILMTQWRDGLPGAFTMGLRQGAYCTGCCWLLMALLFVFGVMNILWIVALSVLVLLEKLLRHPLWFPHAVGVMLFAAAVLNAGRAALLSG